jgi:hypothetical protein
MPLFLTILEGATPDEARPILAIRDAQILATVRAMIHARLRETSPTKPHVHTVLRSVPQEVSHDDE